MAGIKPGDTQLPSHECDAPARLLVRQSNGAVTGIPIVDDGITVHFRKDGPLSVSSRAEVDIPLEGLGEKWYNLIDAFKEGGGMQEALISMRPMNLDGTYRDNYYNVMRGYIGGVGSSGNNVGHLTIFGPYKFITHMPIGHTFAAGTQAGDMVRWVINRINSSQYIMDDIRVEDTDVFYEDIGPAEGFIASGLNPGYDTQILNKSKTFTTNKHTLKDVVAFVMDALDAQMYFRTGPDTETRFAVTRSPGHMYDASDSDTLAEEVADFLGNSIDVTPISNNALYEMKPFNGMRVIGKAGDILSVGGSNTKRRIPLGKPVYTEAEAWYPPLVERAGGKVFREHQADKYRSDTIEAEARNTLKEYLNETSGGTMTFPLTPSIFPFDQVRAQPSCAGVVDEDLPSLVYEVERVSHTVTPKSSNSEQLIPETEVAVSMAVNPLRIRTQTNIKDAQPAEGVDEEGDKEGWEPILDT